MSKSDNLFQLAHGAEVACEAHNLEDPGSKPGVPLFLFFSRNVINTIHFILLLGVGLSSHEMSEIKSVEKKNECDVKFDVENTNFNI